MSTPERIDLEQWDRRDHFELFRGYRDPFFDLSVRMHVGPLRRATRRRGHSLFAVVLYAFSRAMNAGEPLRLRTDGHRVERWPVVHPGWTVLAEDGTFRFAHGEHREDRGEFLEAVREATAAARAAPGLPPAFSRRDLFYASCLPWVDVAAVRPERSGRPDDSSPRLVWGRLVPEGEGDALGVTLTVHHALVDGLHASRFLRRAESALRAYSEQVMDTASV